MNATSMSLANHDISLASHSWISMLACVWTNLRLLYLLLVGAQNRTWGRVGPLLE